VAATLLLEHLLPCVLPCCLQVVSHSPLQQLHVGVPLPPGGWRELGSCLGGLQQLRGLSFAGSCCGDAALQVGGNGQQQCNPGVLCEPWWLSGAWSPLTCPAPPVAGPCCCPTCSALLLLLHPLLNLWLILLPLSLS
jgi:hypothetical protein